MGLDADDGRCGRPALGGVACSAIPSMPRSHRSLPETISGCPPYDAVRYPASASRCWYFGYAGLSNGNAGVLTHANEASAVLERSERLESVRDGVDVTQSTLEWMAPEERRS